MATRTSGGRRHAHRVAGEPAYVLHHYDWSESSLILDFVPEANIVGKAFLIWMNFGNLSRVGTFFQ